MSYNSRFLLSNYFIVRNLKNMLVGFDIITDLVLQIPIPTTLRVPTYIMTYQFGNHLLLVDLIYYKINFKINIFI